MTFRDRPFQLSLRQVKEYYALKISSQFLTVLSRKPTSIPTSLNFSEVDSASFSSYRPEGLGLFPTKIWDPRIIRGVFIARCPETRITAPELKIIFPDYQTLKIDLFRFNSA